MQLKKALIFLILLVPSVAFSHQDEDSQFWNTEVIKGKIGKETTLKIEEEFRMADSWRHLYYYHTDLGVDYRITDWINLALFYRQIYETKQGTWKEENRPHIDLNLKFKKFTVRIHNRLRVEYRFKHGSDNELRLRYKLSLSVPLKISRVKLKPFIKDEIFYTPKDNEGLSRNRLYVGISTHIAGPFVVSVFYMRQSTKKDTYWKDYNITGLKLKASFK